MKVCQDTDGQKFTFEYDENGNMITKQYANKEMERYQYDANNRRIRLDEYMVLEYK